MWNGERYDHILSLLEEQSQALLGLNQIAQSQSKVIISLSAKITELMRVQTAMQEKVEKERDSDRRFMLTVLTALTQQKPQPTGARLPTYYQDFFADLPLGHPDGFKNEELGLAHDKPQTQE